MSRYAMNSNDGRIVFNSEAVTSNVNYVEIDDDICAAMEEGKLTWQVVANAVRAKRNNDPTFDWAQYDLLRDRLNVRKAKFAIKDANRDVTGVGAEKPKSINPSVSFVELNRTDAGGASTEDNTNVGGLSHPAPAPENAPAPAKETARKSSRVSVGSVNI